MTLRTRWATTFLLTLATVSSAHGQGISAVTICTDPLLAVCGTHPGTTAKTQAAWDAVATDWAARIAAKKIAAAHPELKFPTTDAKKILSLVTDQNPIYREFQDTTEAVAVEVAGNIRPMVDRLLVAFEMTLPELFLEKTALEKAQRIIRRIRYLPVELVREIADPSYYTELCGATGLESTASYDPRFRALLICPGIVFTAARSGGPGSEMKSSERAFHGMSWILSHEIAHSIDSMVFPDEFGARVRELKTNYPNVSTSDNHREAIADWIATQVLRHFYSGAIAKQGAAQVQVEILRSLSPLRSLFCEIEPESERGGYLANHDRIKYLLGKDSGLREPLGCK